MANEKDFVIDDGVLTKYTGKGGDVVIPDGVTAIGSNSFLGCDLIRSISLPDGVINIGDKAFDGCSNLINITFPESLMYIGDYAFYKCSRLTDFNFPDSLKEIGNGAFAYCTSLTSITLPAQLEMLEDCGMECFKGCTSINNVVILSSATYYGEFQDCSNLQSVTFYSEAAQIERDMFSDCSALKKIILPQKLQSIESRAFANCSSLEELILPDQVEKLGTNCFVGCNSLREVQCTDEIFSLFLVSFATDKRLSVIYQCLSEKLRTNASMDKKFSTYCKKNQDAILDMALSEDNDIAVVNLLPYLGKLTLDILKTFLTKARKANASSVTAVLLDIKAKNFSKAKEEETENLAIEKELGIQNRTLADWKKLYKIVNVGTDQAILGIYKGEEEEVWIPEQVGKRTVIGLHGTFKGNQQIITVHIPNTVTKIEDETFSGCVRLTEITLPKKLSLLGYGAFYGCTMLKELAVPEKVKTIPTSLCNGCIALDKIILPSKCREIESHAFNDCPSLKHITIPISVKKIDDYAFRPVPYVDYEPGTCPDLTIHAPAGSYAETYAKENEIPFVAE